MSDSDEQPLYLTSLEGELPTTTGEIPQASQLIDPVWASDPTLIEKSLEQLEAEDSLNRKRLVEQALEDRKKALHLQQQTETYKQLLQLAQGISHLARFRHLPEFRKVLRSLLKAVMKTQQQFMQVAYKPKLKHIARNNELVWEWVSDLAREWSTRLNLKIGADVVNQALREAEKTKDASLDAYINKELRLATVVQRQSAKKPKHRDSKHRKLKFDIHEKLVNFMSPETAPAEGKHKLLAHSLFGHKEVLHTAKVHLDIPLI